MFSKKTLPQETAIKPHAFVSLDGVRGLACLLVVAAHMTWISRLYANAEMGQLGVMLFFTLSGFLMAWHYMPGQLSLRYWGAFLLRRFMRVYPLYALVVLAVWGIAIGTDYAYFNQFTGGRILDHLLLDRATSVFWTVPVELAFYLLFSILAPFCLLVGGRLTLPLLVLVWAGFSASGLVADKLSVWPYVPFFVAGMIVALVYAREEWLKVNNRLWNGLACFCFVIIAFFGSTLFRAPPLPLVELWWHSGFFSFLMALTILSVSKATTGVQKVFSHPIPRFIGQISYSLYLTHFFIFVVCYHVPIGRSIFTAAIIFPCSIAVAWLLYKTIERPFHKAGVALSQRLLHQ